MSVTRVVNPSRLVDFSDGQEVGLPDDVSIPAVHRLLAIPSKRAQRGLTSSCRKPNDVTSAIATAAPVCSPVSQPGLRQETNTICLPNIDPGITLSREDVKSRSAEHSPPSLPTLPRSKKTTKLKVNSHSPDPRSQGSNEGSPSGAALLAIEGQDLRLPPPRTPTGPRQHSERFRHRPDATSAVVGDLGLLDGDEFQSLEDSLKELLLCQAMGVIIQITGHKDSAEDSEGVARAMFHCDRCLRHWADYGRPPPDCREPEARVGGPSFAVSSRNHEIIQRFSRLSSVDKQCFLEAIHASTTRAILSSSCQGGETGSIGIMCQGDNMDGHVIQSSERKSTWGQDSEVTETPAVPQDARTPQFCIEPLQTTAIKDEDGSSGEFYHLDTDGKDGCFVQGATSSSVCDRRDHSVMASGKSELTKASGEASRDAYVDRSQGSTETYIVTADGIAQDGGTPVKNRGFVAESRGDSTTTSPITSTNLSPVKISEGNGEGTQSGNTWHRSTEEGTGQMQRKVSQLYDETGAAPMSGLLINPHLDVEGGAGEGEVDMTHREVANVTCDKYPSPQIVSCQDACASTDQSATGQLINPHGFRQSDQDLHRHAHDHVSMVIVRSNNPNTGHTDSFNNSAGTEAIDSAEFAPGEDGGANDESDDPGATSTDGGGKQDAEASRHQFAYHDGGDSDRRTGSRAPLSKDRPTSQKSPNSRHGLGRGSGGQISRHENGVNYMGVKDKSGDQSNQGISSQDRESPTGSHANISKGDTSSGTPIRNSAVRNVTGKPETKPGTLERHMFATPKETLAKTNALTAAPKSSGEGLNTTKPNTSHQEPASNIPSNLHSSQPGTDNTAATKLPPLPKPLLPLSVQDTDKSKTKDRRRSLGQPRMDHPLPKLVDRERQEQTANSTAVTKNEKPVKRPPPPVGIGRETASASIRREGIPSSGSKPTASRADQERLIRQNDLAGVSTSKDVGLGSTEGSDYQAVFESMKGEFTSGDNDGKRRDSASPMMKTLFNEFDKFELSLSPPPSGSLPPVSTDKSFRMTYSTLPRTFDWDVPRQAPGLTRGTPSPQPLGLAFDRRSPGEGADARLKPSTAVDNRSAADIYDKSARRTARTTGGRAGISPSSSGISQVSSAAENVWETVSDVFRKHTAELQKLERLVALKFPPLTSAFTFSMFGLPPQYVAHNRLLREQALQIRALKKPKKIVMKFATKAQREAATRRPVPTRPLKPVK